MSDTQTPEFKEITAAEVRAAGIDLKNIRTHEDMSEETLCFSATLYLDGERLAEVKNEGMGGSNMYYPVKGKTHDDVQKAHDRAKFIEEEFGDLDICLSAIISHEEERRWLKRNSKNKTLFRLPDTPADSWRTVTRPYSDKVRDAILKKYPEATVLDPATI